MLSELALQAVGAYPQPKIPGALVDHTPLRWPTQGTEETEPARA